MKNEQSLKQKKIKNEKIAEKSEKKEEKRDKILKAATELLTQNGYANTRIIDIAKAADVAKGTVYEYFSSKDELVIEWVKQISMEINVRTVEALKGDESAEEKLRKYFRIKQETFALMKPLLKFAVEKGHEVGNEEKAGFMTVLMMLVNSEREILHSILSEGISDSGLRSDLDIKSAAALILSSVTMFTLLSDRSEAFTHYIENVLPGLDEISADSVLNLIFNGLKEK